MLREERRPDRVQYTSLAARPGALVIRRHVQLASRRLFDLLVFVQNLKHSTGGARQQFEPCSSGSLGLLHPGAR